MSQTNFDELMIKTHDKAFSVAASAHRKENRENQEKASSSPDKATPLHKANKS